MGSDARPGPPSTALAWRMLVYRVPPEPASKRVSVWRDLKRLGALYLQQCVCIVPDIDAVADELERTAAKIPPMGGEITLVDVPRLRPDDEAKIVAAFRAQRAREYGEIVEECETKFVKEVEFEHFRQNYTFEEAEEIEEDLDKIRRWFDRVLGRDWFGADRRDEVESWLARCQELLTAFEEEVYRRRGADEGTAAPVEAAAVLKARGRRARARAPRPAGRRSG